MRPFFFVVLPPNGHISLLSAFLVLHPPPSKFRIRAPSARRIRVGSTLYQIPPSRHPSAFCAMDALKEPRSEPGVGTAHRPPREESGLGAHHTKNRQVGIRAPSARWMPSRSREAMRVWAQPTALRAMNALKEPRSEPGVGSAHRPPRDGCLWHAAKRSGHSPL